MTEVDYTTFTVDPESTITEDVFWSFRKETSYDIVPGKWTIAVLANGVEILTKDFEVYSIPRDQDGLGLRPQTK